MKYPDVVSIYLAEKFGQWVDVKVFEKILQNNSLKLVVKYNKIFKEVSDSMYDTVAKQFPEGLIEISKVEGLEDIIKEKSEDINDKELRDLMVKIF